MVDANLPWHALDGPAALARLDSAPEGLSEAEAAGRLAAHGPNALPKPRPPSLVRVFLRQFANPLIYLLLAAAAVSAVIGEPTDALFILAVLLVNAAVGTAQEWKADQSARALDLMIERTAVVRRDGHRRTIDAAALVPGDIVLVESGVGIAADLLLLDGRELTADEALLTGESASAGKAPGPGLDPAAPVAERTNMLHAGTILLAGRATGLVVATGAGTEVGRIASGLARAAPPPPPLVVQLEKLTRRIGLAILCAVALLALVLFWTGLPATQVFFVAVALAVSAIPEGLPVTVTVALAIATARMAERRVIVRALPAVEGLGACTVIASDKTGTLTLNALTARRIALPDGTMLAATGDGYWPVGTVHRPVPGAAGGEGAPLDPAARAAAERLMTTALTANEARLRVVETDGAEAHLEMVGDTVDVALLALGAKLGLDRADLPKPSAAIPYEPVLKFAAAFVADGERLMAHVKGAAETVLEMCGGDRAAALAAAERLAAEGHRVLAFASGPVERTERAALAGLDFLGLVGLIDPLRPAAAEAVARCRSAGIRVVMVTGDHPVTALAIARELGLAADAAQVMTGPALAALGEGGAGADLAAAIAAVRVFARVDPLQKLAIVEALQQAGGVVAVTGDGVNDAPALRQADIGVAMGKAGTDVARGAADLIVADDDFASIVNGVEEGRIAHDNLRKIVLMQLSTGAAEIMIFAVALAAGLPLPLFAVQLLWLNMVTNGVQDVALAFERGEPDVLARAPRPPGGALIDRTLLEAIVVYGLAFGAAAFLLFDGLLRLGHGEAEARSALLLLMVAFENVLVLACRSERRSLFAVPVRANPYVVAAALGTFALHVAVMHIPAAAAVLHTGPISAAAWVAVGLGTLAAVLVSEGYKLLRRRAVASP